MTKCIKRFSASTQAAEHGPLRVTKGIKDPTAYALPGTEKGRQIANDPVGTDVKRPNGLLSNCLQRKWAKKGVFLAVIRSYATRKPARSFASMKAWYMALLAVLVLLQHQEMCCVPPGPLGVSWAGPTSRLEPSLIVPVGSKNPDHEPEAHFSQTVIRSYAIRKPARSFASMNSWYGLLLVALPCSQCAGSSYAPRAVPRPQWVRSLAQKGPMASKPVELTIVARAGSIDIAIRAIVPTERAIDIGTGTIASAEDIINIGADTIAYAIKAIDPISGAIASTEKAMDISARAIASRRKAIDIGMKAIASKKMLNSKGARTRVPMALHHMARWVKNRGPPPHGNRPTAA